jgi:four helix bundle protein
MRPEDLRVRTKRFALDIISLWRRLPSSKEFQDMGDQLRRAADAVASNYRAARCGRSHAEFRAKLGTVREEADECQHWLEMLEESGLEDEQLKKLRQESSELVAIFTASLKTANERGRKRSTEGK